MEETACDSPCFFLDLPGQDGVGMGGGWLAALKALTWGQSSEPWYTVPPLQQHSD